MSLGINSRLDCLDLVAFYSSYQIINLMVPAAGHENDFTCLLDDFKRLTGFFRVREKTPVSNLGRRHIVREVAVSVAQELLLTGRIQEPFLPATDVCRPTVGAEHVGVERGPGDEEEHLINR